MECEKLYLQDPQQLACPAVVTACTPRGDGTFDVETDRTPLFPEGGGQLSDVGTMEEAHVLYCFEANGTVLHRTDAPFEPGQTVRLAADRQARLIHTQQHTGEHLLSFAYAHLFGAENVGFHMAETLVTIDLDRELTDAQIAEGELFANEMVWADRAVRIFTVDASELSELPLRKKNEKLRGAVRIVEIEGGEMCTCCGTHFTHTAPVGLIKVLDHVRYKQGCRITFVCGALALQWFAQENRELRRTAARLSVKTDGVYDALLRKEAQIGQLHDTLREKNAQLAGLYSAELLNESIPCKAYRLVVKTLSVDFETAKHIVECACKGKNLFVVLFCADGGRCRYLCMAGEGCPASCRDAAQIINQTFGAKGGGNPKMAQGSFEKPGDFEEKITGLTEMLSAL
ncbi:MAG: alanyl-tRNA editing protein [Hominenteromicrobium sp.]